MEVKDSKTSKYIYQLRIASEIVSPEIRLEKLRYLRQMALKLC
jgi:hypothetical protein